MSVTLARRGLSPFNNAYLRIGNQGDNNINENYPEHGKILVELDIVNSGKDTIQKLLMNSKIRLMKETSADVFC